VESRVVFNNKELAGFFVFAGWLTKNTEVFVYKGTARRMATARRR
jgi:hypothetical protein